MPRIRPKAKEENRLMEIKGFSDIGQAINFIGELMRFHGYGKGDIERIQRNLDTVIQMEIERERKVLYSNVVCGHYQTNLDAQSLVAKLTDICQYFEKNGLTFSVNIDILTGEKQNGGLAEIDEVFIIKKSGNTISVEVDDKKFIRRVAVVALINFIAATVRKGDEVKLILFSMDNFDYGYMIKGGEGVVRLERVLKEAGEITCNDDGYFLI